MMLDIMNRHGLEVPGAMTVLSRALLTLEGTLRTINPSFNIANEATALLPELAGQQSEMLQQQLEKEVVRALPSLRTLPGHLEAVATQLRSGRLTHADRAVRRGTTGRSWTRGSTGSTFAAVGVIGLLSAALLLIAAAIVGKTDDDFRSTLQVFGFFGIIVTAVIQMRVVAQILRRDDGGTNRRV